MPRELGVNVDNMYVALGGVANDGLVVLASRGVSLDVNAEGAVELQLQAVMVVSMFWCGTFALGRTPAKLTW